MKIEELTTGDIIEIPLRYGHVHRALPARVEGVARRGGNGVTVEARWLDTGEVFRFWRCKGTSMRRVEELESVPVRGFCARNGITIQEIRVDLCVYCLRPIRKYSCQTAWVHIYETPSHDATPKVYDDFGIAQACAIPKSEEVMPNAPK